MIVTPDGRRVFWLNSTLYGLPMLEAQIVQEKIDHLRVCYVPAPGFCRADAQDFPAEVIGISCTALGVPRGVVFAVI